MNYQIIATTAEQMNNTTERGIISFFEYFSPTIFGNKKKNKYTFKAITNTDITICNMFVLFVKLCERINA
jgi:hypothetical protein